MNKIHPSKLQVGDLFKLPNKDSIVFRKTENKSIPGYKHLLENGYCYNAEYVSGGWVGSPCCIYDGNKADDVILVDKVYY